MKVFYNGKYNLDFARLHVASLNKSAILFSACGDLAKGEENILQEDQNAGIQKINAGLAEEKFAKLNQMITRLKVIVRTYIESKQKYSY